MEKLLKKQLLQIVRNYNLHVLIPNYHKMKKHELVNEMNKHLAVDESTNKIIRKQPWRLCIMDEINETIIRLEAIDPNLKIIKDGKKLLRLCSFYIKDLQSFRIDLAKFLKESLKIFIKSMLP